MNNRAIKFRGYSHERREWIYGCYVTDGVCHSIATKHPNFTVSSDIVDPASLCQFTGLHDKNDVEIYEGDLIQASTRRDKGSYSVYKVHYDSVYGAFVGHKVKSVTILSNTHSHPLGELRFDAEVIGNIYENPELLENPHD